MTNKYLVNGKRIRKLLNPIKRFINITLKRPIDYIDQAHKELFHLIEIIGKQVKDFIL